MIERFRPGLAIIGAAICALPIFSADGRADVRAPGIMHDPGPVIRFEPSVPRTRSNLPIPEVAPQAPVPVRPVARPPRTPFDRCAEIPRSQPDRNRPPYCRTVP